MFDFYVRLQTSIRISNKITLFMFTGVRHALMLGFFVFLQVPGFHRSIFTLITHVLHTLVFHLHMSFKATQRVAMIVALITGKGAESVHLDHVLLQAALKACGKLTLVTLVLVLAVTGRHVSFEYERFGRYVVTHVAGEAL